MADQVFSAGVYGATGYIGAELLRRLLIHPRVELRRVCAADHLGQTLGDAQPHLEGWSDLRYTPIPERESEAEPLDVLFLALPHDVSYRVVAQLTGSRTRIIDCSGAFRVEDKEAYAEYYGRPHPLPELLKDFVYGLPEVNQARLANAKYVASPGCFATCIELGLLPIAQAGKLQGDVDTVAITGSSGAGSVPLRTTHHPSRAGNLRVYKPLTHPHVPEIERLLTHQGARQLRLNFVPVAAPLVRGILATSIVRLTAQCTQEEVDAWIDQTFESSPFVRRPASRLPEVVAVAGSNHAEVSVVVGQWNGVHQLLTCVSALDNLLKGGAGQAIQSMNLMLGLEQTCGLRDPGGYP